MRKPAFLAPSILADRLFAGAVTTNYLVVAFILLLTGAHLAYIADGLPDTARVVAMMGTLLGVARLFNSRLMRWAWLGLMGLLSIIPLLDVLLLII